MTRLHRTGIFLFLVAIAQPAVAQVTGKSAGEGSPALGDDSVNVREGSGPVHERGRTVHETSAGRLSGKPVHGSGPVSQGSGPVSDISRGAVSDRVEALPAPIVDVEPVGAADLDRLTAVIRAVKPLPRVREAGEEKSTASRDGEAAN